MLCADPQPAGVDSQQTTVSGHDGASVLCLEAFDPCSGGPLSSRKAPCWVRFSFCPKAGKRREYYKAVCVLCCGFAVLR